MKKVLIITYYWPPSGGPGVQRVLKFVKYLPQFGWQPIILTVENGDYPAIDESLVKEIPESCKVYKTKTIEPHGLYKKILKKKNNDVIPTFVLNNTSNESFKEKIGKYIRANFFIPDARIGWNHYIVKTGIDIIKKENPYIILSSSPPHSLNIGVRKLAKKFNIKWIADFRDPWTDAFWLTDIKRNKLAQKIDENLEYKTINSADTVITVSKSIVKQLKEKTSTNLFVISNGYDEKDFETLEEQNSEKFQITYTGSISKSQNISNFFEALSKIDKQLLNYFDVNFYSNVSEDIIKLIEDLNLQNIVKINKYLPHNEIIKVMKNSNMLLIAIPDVKNNEGILTGKIFEYLATTNFILGIGPINGDAAEILRETGCGEMYNYSEDLKPVLLKQYDNWKNNIKLKVNENEIQKYSRLKITSQLVDIMESVLENN